MDIPGGWSAFEAEVGARPEDALVRVSMLARALTAGIDADEILTIALRQGEAGLGASAVTVAARGHDGAIVPLRSTGPDRPLSLLQVLVLARASDDGRALWVPSPGDAVRRFPALADIDPPQGAAAAAPLVAHGRTFGVLGFAFEHPQTFGAAHRRFAQALADVCALALAASGAPPRG